MDCGICVFFVYSGSTSRICEYWGLSEGTCFACITPKCWDEGGEKGKSSYSTFTSLTKRFNRPRYGRIRTVVILVITLWIRTIRV